MKNKFVSAVFKTMSVVALIVISLYIMSCQCDEEVYMGVIWGEGNEKDCANLRDLIKSPNPPTITYVCPGEKVTICWGGNVNSNKLEPNLGTVGNAGTKTITVTGDMTIKIVPQNSCASSKEFNIKVISGPTPSLWDARWAGSADGANRCSFLSFTISEAFMSPNIRVIDAEAQWDVTTATGSACSFPPLLTGKNISCLACSSVQLNKTFEKVPLSTPPPAVGEWRWAFIDPACTRKCNPDAVLPFSLTLECK